MESQLLDMCMYIASYISLIFRVKQCRRRDRGTNYYCGTTIECKVRTTNCFNCAHNIMVEYNMIRLGAIFSIYIYTYVIIVNRMITTAATTYFTAPTTTSITTTATTTTIDNYYYCY